MPIVNTQHGTCVDEIENGIYRISIPVDMPPMGFSFNQILIVDDEPLLFHTGPKKMFPLVREAVASVIPVSSLRYVGLSHYESDECGSMNEWLAVAPQAVPVCSQIAALVSVGDYADRAPRGLADGEAIVLGSHAVEWINTPHMPHNWECGYMLEKSTRTLLCGDLFTQPGDKNPPLTEGDILGPSEQFRKVFDLYEYSYTTHAEKFLNRLIQTHPTTLACMHGSSWKGDAAGLLKEMGKRMAET